MPILDTTLIQQKLVIPRPCHILIRPNYIITIDTIMRLHLRRNTLRLAATFPSASSDPTSSRRRLTHVVGAQLSWLHHLLMPAPHTSDQSP
jgi:hypothetical protein